MERIEIETWFSNHPESIRTRPRLLLDRCESEIRGHARSDAWLHARDIAETSLHRYEVTFGLPASEVFVAREVCHEVARELVRHEPHPDAALAESWVGEAVLAELDDEARRILREWFGSIAEREEHETWRAIVRYTAHLARQLIRNEGMSGRLAWDLDHTYPQVAARVTRMLIHEFESLAVSSWDGKVSPPSL